MTKNIAIVGAGIAGLCASLYFSEFPEFSVDVFDGGGDIGDRIAELEGSKNTDALLHGLGGAGGFSDGKLNLTGSRLTLFGIPENLHEEFMFKIYKNMYERFNPSDSEEVPFNEKKNKELYALAQNSLIEYRPIRQKHIGSDNLPGLISKLKNYLIDRGIKFHFHSRIKEIVISEGCCSGIVTADGVVNYDAVILATGRSGQEFIVNLINKHNIKSQFGKIDIGTRLEVPNQVYANLIETSYDPKLKMIVNGTDVRTFCTNPGGYVVSENNSTFVSVNGHAYKSRKSENTNFALLNATKFDDPLFNTHKYGMELVKIISEASDGRILAQKFGDIKKRISSVLEWSDAVKPTLNDTYQGNILDFYPHSIINNLIQATHMLDKLASGVANDSTLFYFPEIKFRSVKVHLYEGIRSSIKNLYFGGDCSGLVGDIMHASAMGWLIAEDIVKRK